MRAIWESVAAAMDSNDSRLMTVLPCGYDSHAGGIAAARDFFSQLAQASGETGLDLLDLAGEELSRGARSRSGTGLADAFADRLSVEILVRAAEKAAALPEKKREVPYVEWWPIAEGMKAGDELLLLLSPAPIASRSMLLIAEKSGAVASIGILREAYATAKNYGRYLAPEAFSEVSLPPYRLFTGGGIFGYGRLLEDPITDEHGTLSGSIGDVVLFDAPVDPVDLGLPTAWSTDWSVAGKDSSRLPSVVLADVEQASAARPAAALPARKRALGSEIAKGTPEPPDGWAITERIGSGGQGATFRASRGGEHAVLKLFAQDHAGTCGSERAEEVCELGVNNRHRNVIWYDEILTDEQGRTWIKMADGGESLQEASAALSLASRLSCMIDAGEALAFLHSKGIVWLDFKPENLLVDEEGTCRLSDPDSAVRIGQVVPGTEVHMPATLPAEMERDVYAFLVSCMRVLAGAKQPDLERGARLGDLPDFSEDPAEALALGLSGVADFEVGPNYLDVRKAADDGLAVARIGGEAAGLSSRPKGMADALECLIDARERVEQLEFARHLDAKLMGQLPAR